MTLVMRCTYNPPPSLAPLVLLDLKMNSDLDKSNMKFGLKADVQCVLKIQMITTATLVLVMTISTYLWQVIAAENVCILSRVISCFYGSVLALAGTILSARAVIRGFGYEGTEKDQLDQSAMVSIYSGLLNKLVIVGGGFAVGLIFLGLLPLYLVTGYIIVLAASLGAIKNQDYGVKYPGSDE